MTKTKLMFPKSNLTILTNKAKFNKMHTNNNFKQ